MEDFRHVVAFGLVWGIALGAVIAVLTLAVCAIIPDNGETTEHGGPR